MERRILVEVVLDNRRSILNLKEVEENRDKGENLQTTIEDKWEIEGTDSDLALNNSTSKIERKFVPTEGDGFSSLRGSGVFPASTAKEKGKEMKKGRFDDAAKVPNPIVIDLAFGNMEAAADECESIWHIASTKSKNREKKKEEKKQGQNEVKHNNRRLLDLGRPARLASQSEYVVQDDGTSGADSGGSRPRLVSGSLGLDPSIRAPVDGYGQPSHPRSHANSPSQSSSSMYYSMPPNIPESPITDEAELHSAMEDSAMKPSGPQVAAGTEGLATNSSKAQGSPSEPEIVTPTAQWFLSLVPHESSVTALIVRPRLGEANLLRARAEETAKTLLSKWTHVDPGVFSTLQPSVSVPFQTYSTYTPHQWHPQQKWYPQPTLTAPPPPSEKQTDSEELARLKKLILDEKAEQDARVAAPSAAPIAPEELLEDQRENTCTEAVLSMQASQEESGLWKAEPPRLQPVIMKDWLGRKFMFPVEMCQTWEVGILKFYPTVWR